MQVEGISNMFKFLLAVSLSMFYSYLARTSPEDVARLEDRTFICTPKERDAIPIPKKGIKSQLGYWKEPQEMEAELSEKFSGCMQGG